MSKRCLVALGACMAFGLGFAAAPVATGANPAPTAAYCTPPNPIAFKAAVASEPLRLDFNHAEVCGGQYGDIYSDGPLNFNAQFTYSDSSFAFTIPAGVWVALGQRVYSAATNETAPATATTYYFLNTADGSWTASALDVPGAAQVLEYTVLTDTSGISSVTYPSAASQQIPQLAVVNPQASTAPDTSQMQPGDLLVSRQGDSSISCVNGEGSTVPGGCGRIWMGSAQTGYALGIAILKDPQENTGMPTPGDMLTTTITDNGTAYPVVYTITSGDTSTVILCGHLVAAINADGTVGGLVNATCSSTGETVQVTSLTSGTAGQYGFAVASSNSADEVYAIRSFSFLALPSNYASFNTDISTGWVFSGPPSSTFAGGAWQLTSSGNLFAPPGQNLILKTGSTKIMLNYNVFGADDGVWVYNGTEGNPTILNAQNPSTFAGPISSKICTPNGTVCSRNGLPSNPGYVGPWLTAAGGATNMMQHQTAGVCAAGTTCTITFTVAWTAVGDYSCTVTPEAAQTTPPYISAKSTTAITFTLDTSAALDYICSGY